MCWSYFRNPLYEFSVAYFENKLVWIYVLYEFLGLITFSSVWNCFNLACSILMFLHVNLKHGCDGFVAVFNFHGFCFVAVLGSSIFRFV